VTELAEDPPVFLLLKTAIKNQADTLEGTISLFHDCIEKIIPERRKERSLMVICTSMCEKIDGHI